VEEAILNLSFHSLIGPAQPSSSGGSSIVVSPFFVASHLISAAGSSGVDCQPTAIVYTLVYIEYNTHKKKSEESNPSFPF
jgi:hypothetical protein